MTIHEASERYNIPLSVLQEYERWGLYDAGDRQRGARQYDEKDLERRNLHRCLCADDIHCRENRLQQLDSLRHCLRKQLEAMGIAIR